jgi:UDPglucose--hexose-1-phosphate uridylyltransferase
MPNEKTFNSQSNSELRKHYFLDRYTIIAPKRNLRPDAFAQHSEPHKAPDTNCHFCHNHEASLWQTPRGKPWQVKVISNAFPALSLDNPQAYGAQEIVINTPNHNQEFSELAVSNIENVLIAYSHRITHLESIRHIRYVLVFKNDGPVAGASVAHAHCQILALPLVPPRIQHESDALNHYFDEHNGCAYCDVLMWEEQQNSRIVASDKHFIAVCPYASSYAFEVWLIPRRHVKKIGELHSTELHSLATFLKLIASKLDNQSISFNYFLQESLSNQDHHFSIKVEPRTTKYAGAELGTGVTINPVQPEYSALWYRNKT